MRNTTITVLALLVLSSSTSFGATTGICKHLEKEELRQYLIELGMQAMSGIDEGGASAWCKSGCEIDSDFQVHFPIAHHLLFKPWTASDPIVDCETFEAALWMDVSEILNTKGGRDPRQVKAALNVNETMIRRIVESTTGWTSSAS